MQDCNCIQSAAAAAGVGLVALWIAALEASSLKSSKPGGDISNCSREAVAARGHAELDKPASSRQANSGCDDFCNSASREGSLLAR